MRHNEQIGMSMVCDRRVPINPPRAPVIVETGHPGRALEKTLALFRNRASDLHCGFGHWGYVKGCRRFRTRHIGHPEGGCQSYSDTQCAPEHLAQDVPSIQWSMQRSAEFRTPFDQAAERSFSPPRASGGRSQARLPRRMACWASWRTMRAEREGRPSGVGGS